VASSALPTGAATSANQTTVIGHLDGVEGLLGTIDADTGGMATSLALLDDTVFAEDVAATAADKGVAILAVRRDADTTLVDTTGDYANLQVNATGALKVSAASLPLPTGATTETTLGTRLSESDFDTKVGSLTEASPASDTASSGLNGRLQRIAQLITTLIGRYPASVGQKTMAGSFPVVVASDQGALTVSSHAVTNAGTFATQVDGAALTALQLADNSAVDHDATVVAGVTQVGLTARTTDPTAVASNDATRATATILGKQIVKLDAIPDLTWNYAAPAGGLVSTTAVTVKAAAGAGIRNYVKSIQVINSHATISTELMLLDGAAGTVLHRGWAQAAGGGYACVFDPPLRGTANTLLEIDEVTATAATGVLVNIQGYVAAE
jgi:hypothetical protein